MCLERHFAGVLGYPSPVIDTPFPRLLGVDEPAEVWMDGEMNAEWVLLAYSRGFFPWPVDDQLAWWCPHERLVFEDPAPRISASTRRSLRRGGWRVSLDEATPRVIEACREARGPDRDGTWITEEIAATYGHLAAEGLVHSCEVWHGSDLIGGVYGLSLGTAFFGESMFSDQSDASKVAFGVLCAWLRLQGFTLIDGQVENSHLMSLGGTLVTRDAYLGHLEQALSKVTLLGPWRLEQDPSALLLTARP